MIQTVSRFPAIDPLAAAGLWLLAANLAGFIAMWADKRRSEAGFWRIPEARLLTIAFIGGSIGTLIAQQTLRHKSRKQPFRSRLILIALFQIVAVLALSVPAARERMMNTIAQLF